MTWSSGTRLGPYEVLAPLGAGGMGEVYRARDTRLDRSVAIKVLSPMLAADPEFRDRFDREARLISQLEHPHICPVYDVGTHDGAAYLVMPCLEGETLAARLQKGALPTAQAIAFAIQIGEGLGRAHRAGIIHRDLKPGNVMLTRAGAVLLDFGLAKPAIVNSGPAPFTVPPTTPAMLTARGTILGTFPYMAPEQLEGADADTRSDIWAFGCIFYEMLTGNPPFAGQSHASLIASILNSEPRPLMELAPSTPASIDHIVRRCLAKAPEARWQSITDVTSELRWAATQTTPPAATGRWRLAAGAAALALVALAAAGLWQSARSEARPIASAPLKLSFVPQPGLTLTPFGSSSTPHFALSPDGTRLAFVATAAGRSPSLWIQSLDARVAQEVSGSGNAAMPFWASDGQAIGFFADGRVKTIPIGGERPAVVASVLDGAGATWQGNTILIGRSSGPVVRVDVPTRERSEVTAFTESDRGHRFPQFLPDGHRFIYTATAGLVMLGDLSSTTRRELIKGSGTAIYRDPGMLLYVRGGPRKLIAQPVDAASLQTTGSPREVLEPVDYAPGSGYLAVSIGRDLIAYWDGSRVATDFEWYDRGGTRLTQLAVPTDARRVAISPDGQRVAFTRALSENTSETRSQIWLMDSRGSVTRVSFGSNSASGPIWSRDGQWLAYSVASGGIVQVLRRALKNLAVEESLGTVPVDARTNSSGNFPATGWSPDTKVVLVNVTNPGSGRDIVALSTETKQVTPLLQDEATEIQASFSPDGKQIAYSSNKTGPWEVYVEPYPRTGVQWQVSTAGGSQPVWRRDGKELFFLAPDGAMMALDVVPGTAPIGRTARALFSTRARQTYPPYPVLYDATSDGQRFLIESVRPGTAPTISVVVNWRPPSR